jgi:hypothetical protein
MVGYALAIWDVIQATYMRRQALRTEKSKRTKTSIGGSDRVAPQCRNGMAAVSSEPLQKRLGAL